MTDLETNQDWKWIDASNFDYDNWKPTAPGIWGGDCCVMRSDAQWEAEECYDRYKCFICNNEDFEWRPIFKINLNVSDFGGETNVYDYFVQGTSSYDNFRADRYYTMESGSFDPSSIDTINYRSLILDKWNEYVSNNEFSKLRVSVYRNGEERQYLAFEIENNDNITNITNWFSKDNFIDSTYYDLPSTSSSAFSYFSIKGDIEGSYLRNFLITDSYSSCTSTTGM